MTTSNDVVRRLQRNSKNIRNICILAHVDHGKTTLADSLIASNGIISQRQAGKVRYMDNREDEQERGITMKSSAIALYHQFGGGEYLVNLIDSPGHIDFSSEVSTAVRLCDGALVVVDAVEGVCPQTHTVLSQAWGEGIKPCLLINKIDRLILELKHSPLEAFYHLQQVLEQVNAVMAMLHTSKVVEAANQREMFQPPANKPDQTGDQDEDEKAELDCKEEEGGSDYFTPESGNVMFSSALDGWGFSVGHFSDMYAKKLGINAEVLRKTLWGNYFLNTKTKRVCKKAQEKGKKPLFVQLVLENIWSVYDAVVTNRDMIKIDKIVNSLNLKLPPRDTRQGDPRTHLSAIFTQWLPLAKSTLDMVISKHPSPLQLSSERVENLLCNNAMAFDSFPKETQQLKQDFMACCADPSVPTVAFVSKLFSIEKSSFPQQQNRPLTQEEIAHRRELVKQRRAAKTEPTVEEASTTTTTTSTNTTSTTPTEDNQDTNDIIFLAFSRVYSGSISKGQKLFVLHPRYDPREPLPPPPSSGGCGTHLPRYVDEVVIGDLFVLMGRQVLPVDWVPAGNIVGIAGLDQCVLKSATLSTTLSCPAFRSMNFLATPIVRVAVEPAHASDMPALVRGMRLLNMADPCVEVTVQGTGEHVLGTAGEVHLQRCMDDLAKQFARVELRYSEPIVPFRETVVADTSPSSLEVDGEEGGDKLWAGSLLFREGRSNCVPPPEGWVQTTNNCVPPPEGWVQTTNKVHTLLVRALPLPEEATRLLEVNVHLLKALSAVGSNSAREIREEVVAKSGEEDGVKKGPGEEDGVKRGPGEEDGVKKGSKEEDCSSKGSLEVAIAKLNDEMLEQLHELREKLRAAFRDAPEYPSDVVDRIWSFGPRGVGPNILLNCVSAYQRPSVWSSIDRGVVKGVVTREHDTSIVSGFQLATLSGPLCEEPMHGVCLVLQQWAHQATHSSSHQACSLLTSSEGVASLPFDAYGPVSGQLVSAMKEGCRRAFLGRPVRLMAATYSCGIMATAEVLGKLYGVLGRRGGRVFSEEVKEGTTLFSVRATLPVAESFGFAEEMRKKTSGLASPQLVFSHWEVIPGDPFWVPSTEEELLHFGEKADTENIARRYMNMVRKRKGLPVDEKLVEHGEKQRTLKKNK